MKMTRIEFMLRDKESLLLEMQNILCNMTYSCDFCPAEKYCRRGHNGMREFLEEEVEVDD